MSSLGDDDLPFQEIEKSPAMSSTPVPPKLASTEASVAHDNASALPPRLNTISSLCGRRNRSEVWNYFTMDLGCDRNDRKARCNFCNTPIKCVDGTSAMHSHLKRCKDRKGKKRQKTIPFTPASAKRDKACAVSGLGPSRTYFKFDQEVCHNELVRMFTVANLPSKIVEYDAFRKFLNALEPRFIVPSCNTLAQDTVMLFDAEKMKLKKFLLEHCSRVCLAIDTWTSCQDLNYICLVAHFIDNDWNLQKKILNFCQVANHSGEVMAKSIEECLNSWELDAVFSLTFDSVSSNDPKIQYLQKWMMPWNSVVMKEEYSHMHRCTHILSLIVTEGLKEIDDSILKIRAAVKYVRSSLSRLSRFKKCAEQEKISFEGFAHLDVEKRWNSTYLMLKAAVKYQKVFQLFETHDNKFVEELNEEKGKGVPLEKDWEYARSILLFLKVFYDATMRISSASCVTSDKYMKEVFGIGNKISQCCKSSDTSISLMAGRMKKKYEKYWGNPNDINMLLLIAVVFDPRHKLEYVNWFIDKLFDLNKAAELRAKLIASLKLLYEHYCGRDEGSKSAQEEVPIDEDDDDPYYVDLYLRSTGRKLDIKFELEKYLEEDCEPYNRFAELDLLNWWKVNSTRFPILAAVAREVLAIPVSSLTLDSAFSVGEMVLDSYYSSLTPKMLEALICTQNWEKSTTFSSFSNEDFEELEKFEQEMVSKSKFASSDATSLDD